MADNSSLIETSFSFLHESPSHAIPYIILLCLALSTGVVGNILILVCFILNKAIRKVGNEFLFNLALADLWITSFAEPMCLVGK